MNGISKIEAEQIIAMLRSEPYGIVAERIDAEIGRQNTDLVETQHTEAEMNLIRGRIQGLRKALEIPRIIAKEAVAAETKPPLKRRR